MLKPTVQVEEVEGFLVAEFWDCLRLDPNPVQDLRRAFENHQRRKGRPEVVVDLNGVGYAGSAALGGFLAMRKQGARIIFCQVEPTVMEVFRVSRLVPLFQFVGTREEGIDLARGEGASDSPTDTAPATPPEPRGAPPLRRSRKPE
jgi:anti-anti-sigma factor